MIAIGIIGYGYWGPNIVRNFSALHDCRVAAVADKNPKRLETARRNYPALAFYEDMNALLAREDIAAVCIVTPTHTHYKIARAALEAGKHVLVEKPMAQSVEECRSLIRLAKERGKVLMVDHTYVYNPAVRKIKEIVENGTLGKLLYFDSTRINLGLIQPDINVVWDLAVHDISILLHLFKAFPSSVNLTGVSHVHNNILNIAYLTLNYESRMIAHFNCSWSSPVKIRHILIGGDKKMVVFNDLEGGEKVKVYDSGYEAKDSLDKHSILYDYRVGDVYSPRIESREALSYMAEDFIASIRGGTSPVSDSVLGLKVVEILEASDESYEQKGATVSLPPPAA